MKLKYILVLFISIVSFVDAFAQQINIAANIVDQNNKPIEYANAQLLNKDSVFIKGIASDQNGKIKLQTNNKQSYWLVISAMGYTPSIIYLKDVASNVELGEIVMQEATTMLDSITVTAQRTIHKLDRQVVFPSTLQQKSANSALDLLYKMALPRLTVNVSEQTIKLIGQGSVLLRINGVNVSSNEIAAIPAKDIIRVEYYDNPGVQFQGQTLIDFIVKKRESGGSLYTNLLNSPHVGFGNDMMSTKFNHKNSEWSATYNLSFRDYKKREIESNTIFNFPDNSIERHSDGIPSPFNYQTHNLNLTYNYTIVDKRIFNVTAAGSFFNNNSHDKAFNYYSEIPKTEYLSTSESKGKSQNPTIDLYYKEVLSKRQNLQFNLVGGYINSTYIRNYQEKNESDGSLSNYYSDVSGKKYSIIGEGVHQIQWEKVQLNSGIKYKLGYTENEYKGTNTENSSLNNSDLYIYSQLQGKLKGLSYGIGAGVSYAYFSDQHKGFKFWTFQPFLSLAQNFGQKVYLQYMFYTNSSVPSLSALSDVSQIIDQYQISQGNPNLKPYRIYSNYLRANYQQNIFQCNLGISHQYYKNAIMQSIYLNEDKSKFIFTSSNQKFYQKTGIDGGINWQIIKDILSLNLNGQINWTQSKGNNYNHKYTSYYYGGQLNLNLKQWTINMGANSRYNTLWGETINYGELGSNAEVSYRYKNLNVGLMGLVILSDKWSAGSKNLSKEVPSTSWSYIDDSAPIICLHLSWNFSWGKQSKAGEKTLKNKDSDSGILKVE